MIHLTRIDPDLNMDRWYVVFVQPTLFSKHAVISGWGRRGTDYSRWKIIPTESQTQAEEIAHRLVAKKIRRGYVCDTNKEKIP